MSIRRHPRLHMLSAKLHCLATMLLLCAGLAGCISDYSYPMNPKRVARFAAKDLAPDALPLATRAWTARASALAAPLLPPEAGRPLTTDDLASNGKPIDVYRHFHFDPARADDFFANFSGIVQSAHVTSPTPVTDDRGHLLRESWPGFSDVEVPVELDLALFARISDRAPGDLDTFVIITPGLFGTLDGNDMRNHVLALRSAGIRVLALEMRGHGETLRRHPQTAITFGVHESSDLLAAARWLKSTHHASRVGLICFSLAGYEAMLTAWLDGHAPVTRWRFVPPLNRLPEAGAEPAFNAGTIVICPPVDILKTAESFDIRHEFFDAPVKASFQQRILDRCAFFRDPPAFSMWGLVERECRRAGWHGETISYTQLRPVLQQFLDMKGPEGAPPWDEGARRMENVRTPMLILHSANDPLATAQGVADLFSRVKNPNIGCIILKRGGHMALPAYATDFYYSLLLNFFDPATAPQAQPQTKLAVSPASGSR